MGWSRDPIDLLNGGKEFRLAEFFEFTPLAARLRSQENRPQVCARPALIPRYTPDF